LRFANNAF
jgi:hypothetical protein